MYGIPSFLEEIPKMGRIFGLWLFICGISHKSICSAFTENCGHKIMFAQDLENLYSVVKTMDLSPEQLQEAKSLGIGEAFIKPYSRSELPTFKIKTPEFKLDRNVTQDELDKIFNPIIKNYDIEFVPESKREAVENMMYGEIKYKSTKTNKMDKINSQEKTSKNNLPVRFLLEIALKPFLPLLKRYENLNLHLDEGKKLKDKLILQGYINEFSMKLDKKRGRSKIYLSLTQKGRDYLVNKGLWKQSTPYFEGKGGYVHALIQRDIKIKFEDIGYKAVIEENHGSGCDVAVYSNDGTKNLFAVEVSVTTSYEHELENIKRDLVKFEKVILLVILLREHKRTINTEISKGFEKDQEISYKTIDNESSLKKAEEFISYLKENLDASHFSRIGIMTIKDFNRYLDELSKDRR